MNLEQLKRYQQKPAPFTPGEPLFWDDPYISEKMLAAHLNPKTDQASRRPEIIERSVAWLTKALHLNADSHLVDLGCGPGLYAARFAERGIQVTGVDYSKRSIEYAKHYAEQQDLEIEYRYQNYLELEDTNRFDAALLIFGDFCPLSPEQRSTLLQNIRSALKPSGYFALDVTTRAHRKRYGNVNQWYISNGGFWKPGLYLALEEGFDYPEESIYLDQTVVVEENGKVSVYRNWFQDYTHETITAELEAGGFNVLSIWNDLTGQPYQENTEWIGVVTQASK